MCKQTITISGTGFPCQAILQMNPKTEKPKMTFKRGCKEVKKSYEDKSESRIPDRFVVNPLRNRFTNRKNNTEKVRKPHRSSERSWNHGIPGKIEGTHGVRQSQRR
jgi:hypothetical protein